MATIPESCLLRRRLPGLVVAVACLATTAAAALFAQQNQSDTVRNPLTDTPGAATAGAALYNQTCQSCHGASGQGDRGPALNTTTLSRGSADADLFHTIREGIAGTQMPPFARLSDTETWQLVSYLRSIQGERSGGAVSRETAAAAGDAAAGEGLFYGRAACAQCHEVNGRGGVTGPDLSNAGRLAATALRQKIVNPNGATSGPAGGRGAPAPSTLVARLPDGREVRGVRRNEDTFSVQLVDASGRLHLLDKTSVRVSVAPGSLMPGDYGTRLTEADITNLVAYLSVQHGRDLARTRLQPIGDGVSFARLQNAGSEPHNWLMYWGNYQGTHYSPLDQITPANARSLGAAWAAPVPGGSVLEVTPIVADGVMYVTSGGDPLTVLALDARSGRQIWRYTRPQKVKNPYEINPFNRGVAVLGNRVFVGTLDAALVSLDARTGLPMWDVQLGDTMEGRSITSPPLVVKDKVIVGITGGEFATRGVIQALDAASGRLLWTFYTIPGPGEFGNDSWKSESWKTGGGPGWLTGTYDPAFNLVYWPIGNPAPEFDRSARGDGDNLFTNSVVALDPETGTRKWHFQFTPNDGHDWDSVEDMMLVDRTWHGQPRKLLMHADRNGHFYVLDRTDGRFLAATPFAYQNWNTGFDANGRPKPVEGSNASAGGTFIVYPGAGGSTNFQPPSYSPKTGWFYLEYSENGQQYVSAAQPIERGRQWLGRGSGRGTAPPARQAADPAPNAGIKAIDPETGKTMWDFKIFQGSITNGLIATGGGVVFASTRDGNITALDAKTGAHLWHVQTGGTNAAAPISYAIDGRQYVALAAGNTVYSFALPKP